MRGRNVLLGCSVRELMNDKWVSDVLTHGFGIELSVGKAFSIARALGGTVPYL